MPRRSRFRLALATVALGAALTSVARATDCTPPTAQSTCFDADIVASPFAPSPFFFSSSARALEPRTWTAGLDVAALHHPVMLHAASPDPDGRDVRVVDDLVDATLAAAFSPARGLELGAAVPFVLYRSGTGLSGVTSQTGSDVPVAAFRDLRFGAGYDLFRSPLVRPGSSVGALLRLDLSLPTGARGSFAGDRSVMFAPAVDFDLRWGRFYAAAEERVRLREPVEFGGDRLGTEFVSALGAGVDVMEEGRLSVGLEAFVAPYLSSSPTRTLPDGTRVDPGTITPAEWALSVHSHLGAFVLGLGGGSAFPFSTESRTSPNGATSSETYTPVTSPAFRFMLTARFLPPRSL